MPARSDSTPQNVVRTLERSERADDKLNVVRVRDVARDGVYDLSPDEPILRGPYELFNPIGAVRQRGGLVDWVQAGVIRSARSAPSSLGTTRPGERVLVRLPPRADENANEWWLCEVEAVCGTTTAE